MDHVDPEKHDEWNSELEAPLPWRALEEPTEAEVEREYSGFAAYLGGAG